MAAFEKRHAADHAAITANDMSSATTPEDLRGIVVDAMKGNMHRGVAYAQQSAATELRLTARRVRAYWDRSIKLIPFQEADRLRAWHRSWKRQEVARLANELAVLQLQLGALDE